jgi:hypothetical protein
MPYAVPFRGAGKHRDWITLGVADFLPELRQGTIRTYSAQAGWSQPVPEHTYLEAQ